MTPKPLQQMTEMFISNAVITIKTENMLLKRENCDLKSDFKYIVINNLPIIVKL